MSVSSRGARALLLSLCLAGPLPAAPWDVLPWFGNDDGRKPGDAIEMQLEVEIGGKTYEIPGGVDGLSRLGELLRRVFPGTGSDGEAHWRSSATYGFVERLLTDDHYRGEVQRIAGLTKRSSFKVWIKLDDNAEELIPGVRIKTPKRCTLWVFCDEHHTVEEGETLEGLAERYGVSVEELERLNKKVLEVHPHTSRGSGRETIKLGEAGLDARSDRFEVFLHEAGHVGDDTRCSNLYGPDGSHFLTEILSPASAFKEGWGNYQGAHIPGNYRDLIESPETLRIEKSAEAQAELGPFPSYDQRYVEILPGDRTLGDEISNEMRVAQVLYRLEDLPPGRSGIEKAFLGTDEDCRTMASFLEEYVRLHPDARDPAREVLEEETENTGSHTQYLRLLEGTLPGCMGPKDLPRSRDYEPGLGRPEAEILKFIPTSSGGPVAPGDPGPGGSLLGFGGGYRAIRKATRSTGASVATIAILENCEGSARKGDDS